MAKIKKLIELVQTFNPNPNLTTILKNIKIK
jgi:hypothetical protein